MKKIIEKSNRGGARAGAGRPEGRTKEGISATVDKDVLARALKKWKGKTSPLIEKLLRDYVD